VDERRLLNGILFVLRTGRHGDALNATGICKKSTAHDRYRDWKKAGVFAKLWVAALQEYDALKGIDWEWLAMDGALTKAPLGGEKKPDQIRPGAPWACAKSGTKRSLLTEGRGVPLAVVVAGANQNDFKLAGATLKALVIPRPRARLAGNVSLVFFRLAVKSRQAKAY
jgi:transposase